MRKLFTGRFHRIPVAVLAVMLLSVLVAGGVVAAVGGYVLWQGSSDITVDEPVSIYYGSSMGTCNTTLTLNTTMPDVGLWPGVCWDTWFRLKSGAPHNLLVKASVIVGGGANITVDFFDSVGNSSTILSEDGGLLIKFADGDVYVRRHICVDGSATPGVYPVSSSFTRESPPVP